MDLCNTWGQTKSHFERKPVLIPLADVENQAAIFSIAKIANPRANLIWNIFRNTYLDDICSDIIFFH